MWLNVNGASIYGTRHGPIQGLDWCRSTTRPGKVYLHVFDWPELGDIRLPAPLVNVTGAYLLADRTRQSLRTQVIGEKAFIKGPDSAPDPVTR